MFKNAENICMDLSEKKNASFGITGSPQCTEKILKATM